MDMSGMSGMGGMDMSSAGMFTPTNKKVAHSYWYFVAAIVGVLVFRRVVDGLRIYYIERKIQQQPRHIPFKPGNAFTQSYDTVIAICRELAYPQIWTFTGKFTKYFTPPPLGRILLLLTYWAVILTMLWSNVILTPSSPNWAYHWEIVGFRAAWVSVTQLPLIYILSGKANIITILTGISYERLNWLHRWVARTLFLTLIVHWSFFFTEWDIAGFVKLELEMMPMVKYGFGAWATIGWMVIAGFAPVRSASYELWFLQHLAAAAALLWLVHSHVPAYAKYHVWFAVGVIVFDRLVRTLMTLCTNLHLFQRRVRSQPGPKIGYEAEVTCLSNEYVHVIVRNVGFSWQPGQHLYLSIPRVGILEAHPFTIANIPRSLSGNVGPDHLEFYIRVHNGFTRRLHRRCQRAKNPQTLLSFFTGPWGIPPAIDRFESLILIATGNGSSFTFPIFQKAILSGKHLRQIQFIWIIRHPEQLDWFKDQFMASLTTAEGRNTKLAVHIFITGTTSSRSTSPSEKNPLLGHGQEPKNPKPDVLDDEIKSSSGHRMSTLDVSVEKGKVDDSIRRISASDSSLQSQSEKPSLNVGYGRPDLDILIRPVVEDAWGETGILACGKAEFMGSIRNYVARLSDERAVHKGTGAQGLYLFCEHSVG
ncbi:uncharacterized protein Z518_02012 [Rhinocladiella mackenziei CBS 650.93]|uniref:ferric-chelate reductase (NADPH) n=1 Tax=Rhinocladiella mackenziei CBS 650.93 TaxID=1442369 RepID=A0A0D2INF8_9EURO|nr:uncharacterized protein Z518_02012 [Rhinocladiella mackenziei CBS 650.93]KIX07359.1 hypothetical protein Z518_02012 [Rhinocladiella mackenziei CBS 650.93]